MRQRLARVYGDQASLSLQPATDADGGTVDRCDERLERTIEPQRDLDAERERIVFAGDSPNDEPMFGYFPNAVGVANVLAFRGRMRALPAWITPSAAGAGFVELACHLLAARGLAVPDLPAASV